MELTEDRDLINKMMSIAKEEGLESEVVYSFWTAVRNSNASLEECVTYALLEWDLI